MGLKNMTRSVNDKSSEEIMKRVAIIALLLSISACSNGGRQVVGQRTGLSTSLPSLTGGRIGAVLTTQENCSANMSPQYPGQTSTNNGIYPGQQGGNRNSGTISSSSYSGISARTSNWGTLKLLAIYENEMSLVGSGLTDQRRTTSAISSGVTGFASYGQIRLPGILTRNSGSQIAFSPDGSSILVTRTEDNAVSLISVGDRGRLGMHYQINTGQHPTEIDTAMTPWGSMAAVVTDTGVELIKYDRLSYYGEAVGRPYYSLAFGTYAGSPKSVRFVPGEGDAGSEFIAISVSNGRGTFHTNGGRVLLCDLSKYNEYGESPWETVNRVNGNPRGCYEFNQFSPFAMGRSEHVLGTPIKLAMGSSLAVALSDSIGPVLLNTSDYPLGAFSYPSTLGSGMVNGQGQNLGRHRGYVDIALHPYSENIMVLDQTRLTTYAMDNFFEVGQLDGISIPIAQKASAMAVDPSPNPNFVLVADQGAGRVAVARLNGRTPSHNSYSDFIALGACPIDVAIRKARDVNLPTFPSAPEEVEED